MQNYEGQTRRSSEIFGSETCIRLYDNCCWTNNSKVYLFYKIDEKWFHFSVPLEQFKFPAKSILLMGDEKEGVPMELFPHVDQTIEACFSLLHLTKLYPIQFDNKNIIAYNRIRPAGGFRGGDARGTYPHAGEKWDLSLEAWLNKLD